MSISEEKISNVLIITSSVCFSIDLKTPELKQEFFKDYDVNVIEIIGHTDEVPVQSKIIKSNLDKHIKSVLYGNKPIEDLDYVSNVELGLIRALSVKLFLQKIISKRSSVHIKR